MPLPAELWVGKRPLRSSSNHTQRPPCRMPQREAERSTMMSPQPPIPSGAGVGCGVGLKPGPRSLTSTRTAWSETTQFPAPQVAAPRTGSAHDRVVLRRPPARWLRRCRGDGTAIALRRFAGVGGVSFRVAFGDEARVRAHVATLYARAFDVAVPEQTLVGEPAAAFFADHGGDCHVASCSSMMLSRSPARVSVNTRLAGPRGRTSTTSNDCA